MVGQRLLHYEIVKKLGEGGMGVVYKARDTHLDRFIAIKVLPPGKVSDPARKARFVQEAKSASALNHPNIITIHDIASDAGFDFIAMEYVSGKTLDQVIPRKGIRLNEALRIALQMADALDRAHAAGIIHRDLKPANIMLDERGQVKLLDFGLAKLTEPGASWGDETRTAPAHTAEGTIVGTAAYMSPEQAEGKPVDARSDIFSFGCVLYEMLTGHRPFSGDSQMSTLGAILHKEPPPLEPDVPHDLARIVLQCLRKDPRRRFQHMDDLKVALLGVAEESESGKLSGSLPPARPARGGGAWRAAAALILAAAAGGSWLAWNARRQVDTPLSIQPFTAYPGNEAYPTFSPDAKQGAFMWDEENRKSNGLARFDLFVKLIGSPSHLRLTPTDNTPANAPAFMRAPSWSPDGSTILFVRTSGNRMEFSSVPALGGPERLVREYEWAGALWQRGHCQLAAWMPDSKRVVFFDGQMLTLESGELRRLWPVPAAGSGSSDGCIAVSPDGRTVAFTRFTGQVDGEIYTLGIAPDGQPAGEPRQLTHLKRLASGAAFTADGKEVLFVLRRAWVSGGSLYRVPVSGSGEPRLVPVGQGVTELVATSSRSDRFIFVQNHPNTNVYRLPADARNRDSSEPVPLIASSRLDYGPVYSPDGSEIAFVSDRGGQVGVWKCKADGSAPVELFSRPGDHADNPSWSPDGRHVLLSYAGRSARDVWVVPSQGGAPRQLTDHPDDDQAAFYSRDGKWIYFGSNRSGDYQVWKMPAAGGSATQVTRQGGAGGGIESFDGKWVYYYKTLALATPICRVTAGGGEEAEEIPLARNYGFHVAEDGIYFLFWRSDSGEYSVQFKEFRTGATRTIVRLDTRTLLGLAVSPDRRNLLFVRDDGAGSDLILVENFR